MKTKSKQTEEARNKYYEDILKDELKIRKQQKQRQELESKEREFPHVVYESIYDTFNYADLKNMRLVSKTSKDEADREIKRRYAILTGHPASNVIGAMKFFEESNTYNLFYTGPQSFHNQPEDAINYIKDYIYRLYLAFTSRSLATYFSSKKRRQEFDDIIASYLPSSRNDTDLANVELEQVLREGRINAPWLNNINDMNVVKRDKSYTTISSPAVKLLISKIERAKIEYTSIFLFKIMIAVILEDSNLMNAMLDVILSKTREMSTTYDDEFFTIAESKLLKLKL